MTAQDHWTTEEFQDWVKTTLVSDTERKRWVLHSARLLKGFPVEPSALLAEAVLRMSSGIRTLNRMHPIEANLYGTMRSIASSWWKARKRKPEISLEDLVGLDDEDRDPLEVLLTPEDVQASPEAELVYKQEIEQILKVFEDREDAQLVILGRIDGLKGTALADAAGLDKAGLAAALRLISRRLPAYRREV